VVRRWVVVRRQMITVAPLRMAKVELLQTVAAGAALRTSIMTTCLGATSTTFPFSGSRLPRLG
jgi:hypothetical protein